MSAGSQSNHGTTIVASAADHFGELVIAKSKAFVKKNPVISLTWVGGLLLSIFATGFTPSIEAVRKYEVKLGSLDHHTLSEAEKQMDYWENAYRRSRGMFWSCDDQCQRYKREFEVKRKAFQSLSREYQNGIAEAKSELGLFSQDGVEETRDLFWQKVARGKQFAKRATMWDALFVGISATRRDEGLMAVLLRIAFRLLVNLTFGLFMAVLEFLFSVWRIIWSYQPDPISTVAFFVMAAVGAASLLATWLLGLAALGVTGFYALAKVAENAQIEAGRRGQDPRYASASRIDAQQRQQQQQQQYYQRPYTQQHQQDFRNRRPSSSATQGSGGYNWDHLD